MSIIRLNELPEGSGNLTNDDIFVFMDDPAGSGVTKKISLSQIADAIGGGGGGGNPFDQDLNTFNSPTFDTVAITGSKIYGGGTNSGDGNGYGTIELVPDSGLYSNDQYLIVDPTAPSHIHLRAGGTQDASNAELIIGGEKNHLRINDFSPTVRMQTETLITLDTYYLTSPEFSSAVWETVDGNHRVVINDPSPTVYSAVGALNSTSLFYVIDDGSNYYELTINGSSAPGGSDPVMVYVNQAPPANPTTLTQLTFEIRENRQTYLEANGSDVRIQAADDVRIYSNDVFRLYNYSPNDPIEIFTDYDDQQYRWAFTADGEFISPNGATIGTNGEGALAFYNTGNSNAVAIVNRNIDSGANLALVAVMPSASGGLATITVATTGVDSYEYWDFKDNGILNLASNGIQFSDDSIQNTAAINVVNDAFNTSLVAGTGIDLSYDGVTNTLTINTSGLASSNHTHIASNITDFDSAVTGLINNALDTNLVAGTGINLSYDNEANTLTVSVSTHSHNSSDITDFNSAVSGLLPVKNIFGGNGVSVSSVSGEYTISASGVAAGSAESILTTCFNNTGATLSKGTVVYINGRSGNLPTVQKSIATNEAGSSKTYGILFEDITDNHSGRIIVIGALTDFNTNQFSAAEGSTLYLSPSVSGAMTATKPSAPDHLVSVGKIVRNHNNEGIIQVVVQNGFELQELHNVAISGVTNGQFLQYNSSTQLWVPSSSGNFTTLQVSGTNVSVSGHNHVATDISDSTTFGRNILQSTSYANINKTLWEIPNPSGSPLSFTAVAGGHYYIPQTLYGLIIINDPPSGVYGDFYRVCSFDNDIIVSIQGTGYSNSAGLDVVRAYNDITSSWITIRFNNHDHTTSQITDFNTSVSGLLPTIANSGDNRILTSTGSSVGINAESNLTFNGTTLAVIGVINIDNLRMDANTISSTNPNGNIVLAPNGTGDVQVDADTLRVGDSNTAATITTNGTGNLVLNTNTGTNSGSITIAQGSNGDITIAPNGTGDVYIDADTLRVGDSNTAAIITTNGAGNLTINTNSGTNSGSIVINQGSNGNIAITPNGTGEVDLSKVNIDGGSIDSTAIGANSASTGKFTQLYPTVVNNGNVNGSVATDASAGQIFDMTISGSTTLSNPTNAVDGVTIRWRIRQDGTGGHGVALDTKFQIPSSASSPLPWSTAANAMDILAATYHAGRDKWDIVAFVPGY